MSFLWGNHVHSKLDQNSRLAPTMIIKKINPGIERRRRGMGKKEKGKREKGINWKGKIWKWYKKEMKMKRKSKRRGKSWKGRVGKEEGEEKKDGKVSRG